MTFTEKQNLRVSLSHGKETNENLENLLFTCICIFIIYVIMPA